MKYLRIKSKNEIEVEALSLMGASTKKQDSSKIGKYGSGGKYSISTMLRNNINFTIFSGLEKVEIKTKEVELRGKKFNKIIINNNETSLTTEMGGEEWNNSFSYIREIYSNALDEDSEASLEVMKNLKGEEGYTSYFIELNKDVEDFYKNIGNYFCEKNKECIYSSGDFSIFKSDGNLRLFRKGILCENDKNVKSLYWYNSSNFKINESRVLSDTFDARYEVGKGWRHCNNPNLILELLMTINGTNSGLYEHDIVWGNLGTFNNAWEEVLRDKKLVSIEHEDMFSIEETKGCLALPFNLLKVLKRQFNDLNVLGLNSETSEVFIEINEPPKKLVNKVLDSISELMKTDYKERLNNPKIKYVNFHNSNILGQAVNNEILLSVKLDSYSVPEISKIIIEENEHNLTGFDDETREFQNHLFNLYYEQLKFCK